jgi:transcriptional regulator with XRE-family HTH domain
MMSDLVQRRRAKGKSQVTLAVECGVSLSTLASFEAGRCIPSPRVAALLADAYGVSIDDINSAARSDVRDPLARAS